SYVKRLGSIRDDVNIVTHENHHSLRFFVAALLRMTTGGWLPEAPFPHVILGMPAVCHPE
ncbi:MAG: hypothetical protein WCX84_05190, partial [Syntrophales bacterium]